MLIATLVVSNTAYSQVSDRFPESTTIDISGVRYEAFDLGGYTELLKIDADLAYYSRLSRVLVSNIAQLRVVNDSLSSRVTALLTQRDLLATERDRLRRMWSSENRRRHSAENRVSLGSWFGWGLAAAFAMSTITLGVVVATK